MARVAALGNGVASVHILEGTQGSFCSLGEDMGCFLTSASCIHSKLQLSCSLWFLAEEWECTGLILSTHHVMACSGSFSVHNGAFSCVDWAAATCFPRTHDLLGAATTAS